MLDVRRLRTLDEVSERGSFSAAAEALGLTPSAVSQQITALEREIGMALVERGPRGVVLTEPGRILARGAETVVHGLTAVERELAAFREMRSGIVRIAWFATAGSALGPRAITAFRAQHPDVQIDLYQADPDESLDWLRSRAVELALVYQFTLEPPLPTEIEQIDLLDDPIHIGLPPGHRLARSRRVALGDLAGEPWIQGVRHGSTLDVLPKACREAGFEPKIALRTDDRSVVEGLVAAGFGVALIPRLTLPAVRPDIVVRPLDAPGLFRKVRLALPPGTYRSPATAAMVAILREACIDLALHAVRRLEGTQYPR